MRYLNVFFAATKWMGHGEQDKLSGDNHCADKRKMSQGTFALEQEAAQLGAAFLTGCLVLLDAYRVLV
eukprot:1159673-Pelagomonas_calceolata.AAC.8